MKLILMTAQKLEDVPNVVGTYPLKVALDIVAEYEVFGIMIPVEVTRSKNNYENYKYDLYKEFLLVKRYQL